MLARIAGLVLCALALNAQANFYSIEKESALGSQLAKDFRQAHSPLDNAAASAYIEQMGARLTRALPQPSPFTYHFELTTDSSGTFLEPAALPGGYIFVPAGLILAAKDEAELAGTLAHAMGHGAGETWDPASHAGADCPGSHDSTDLLGRIVRVWSEPGCDAITARGLCPIPAKP
jgi:hypothetical protein